MISVDNLLLKKEGQTFNRKNIKIAPKDLANHIIAFANADGETIDRIVFKSPGHLLGLFRLNNMQHVHFSRNPKITAFLKEYEFIREFGEGIDSMSEEMQGAGQPKPQYQTVSFMLQGTIYSLPYKSVLETRQLMII